MTHISEVIDLVSCELQIVGTEGSAVEVWLSTGVLDFDGLVIGAGDTLKDATHDAIETLQHAITRLRGYKQ